MSIFIPKKINVGFQERKDTYSGKLAYVIYFDQNGKLRKETSWQNWRDEKIPNEIYDNEPLEGFVLNKNVGGVEDYYYYNVRKTYIRVYDPRGFEFEITVQNLLWILQNCDCTRGKGLEGQFIYGWDGTELVLVPVESPDYKDIIEKNDVIHNNTFIKAKELICGATYEDLNGIKYVYMGKFKPWIKKYNTCSGIYPLDDTWKHDINDCRYSWSHYYKYIQSNKFEFFFIRLDYNKTITFKSVNKKFIKMISESTERYSEYTDILNHCDLFSPIDYDTQKIIDLPYENFERVAIEGINYITNVNYACPIVFGIRKEKHKEKYLDTIKVYYDKEKSQFYSLFYKNTSDKYTGVVSRQYYKSIETMYHSIQPVYGVQYLANGNEYERSYYYDTNYNTEKR